MKKDNLIIGLLTAIGSLLLKALILMFLWNYSIPDIFEGVKQVSYPAALAILLISNVLFKHTQEIESKEEE